MDSDASQKRLACNVDGAAVAAVVVAAEGTFGGGDDTLEMAGSADRKGEAAKVHCVTAGQNLERVILEH